MVVWGGHKSLLGWVPITVNQRSQPVNRTLREVSERVSPLTKYMREEIANVLEPVKDDDMVGHFVVLVEQRLHCALVVDPDPRALGHPEFLPGFRGLAEEMYDEDEMIIVVNSDCSVRHPWHVVSDALISELSTLKEQVESGLSPSHRTQRTLVLEIST